MKFVNLVEQNIVEVKNIMSSSRISRSRSNSRSKHVEVKVKVQVKVDVEVYVKEELKYK